MDTENMKRQASTFRKAGRCDKVIEIYDQIWNGNRDKCNEWDYWSYAYCLRKTNQAQKAFDICQEGYRKYPDFAMLTSVYAWCIYDLNIKRAAAEAVDEVTFLRAARAIVDLVQQEDFSPYEYTVMAVIRHYNKKVSFPAGAINEWLNRLDRTKLSTKTNIFRNQNNEDVEQASPKETWYSLKTKALEKLKKYEECVVIGEEALTEVSEFHTKNDIWIRNRMAIAKGMLGRYEEAIIDFKELLKFERMWSFEAYISSFSAKAGDYEQAFKYAIDAALNGDEIKPKVNLLEQLAELYRQEDKIGLAKKHLQLAKAIREQNNWSLPNQLIEAMKQFGVDLTEEINLTMLQRELKTEWFNTKQSLTPTVIGIIKTIIQDGRAGFIQTADEKDYYFRMKNVIGDRRKFTPGQNVIFNVITSFDKKRNRESEEAVFIKIEKVR